MRTPIIPVQRALSSFRHPAAANSLSGSRLSIRNRHGSDKTEVRVSNRRHLFRVPTSAASASTLHSGLWCVEIHDPGCNLHAEVPSGPPERPGGIRCCWCSDSSSASRARFSPSAHDDPDRRRRRRDIDVRAVVRARRTGEDRDAVRLRARRRWGPGAATHPSGSEASLRCPGVPVVPVLAVLYLMLNPSRRDVGLVLRVDGPCLRVLLRTAQPTSDGPELLPRSRHGSRGEAQA